MIVAMYILVKSQDQSYQVSYSIYVAKIVRMSYSLFTRGYNITQETVSVWVLSFLISFCDRNNWAMMA